MADDLQSAGDGHRRDPTLKELLDFMGPESGTREQMRVLCNPHLSRNLTAHEEDALVEIKAWFDDVQKELVAALENGALDKRSYLREMNSVLAESMGRYRAVLGEDRFLRVFGEAGMEPEKLIDEGIFLGGRG